MDEHCRIREFTRVHHKQIPGFVQPTSDTHYICHVKKFQPAWLPKTCEARLVSYRCTESFDLGLKVTFCTVPGTQTDRQGVMKVVIGKNRDTGFRGTRASYNEHWGAHDPLTITIPVVTQATTGLYQIFMQLESSVNPNPQETKLLAASVTTTTLMNANTQLLVSPLQP